MHRTPLDIGQCPFAVDGLAKDVEQTRRDSFAHRDSQRPARVLYRHTASGDLAWASMQSAHMPRVTLRQHFNDDVLVISSAQQRVDGRQMCIDLISTTPPAHRDHGAEVRRASLIADVLACSSGNAGSGRRGSLS